jgi:prepilin-type N-terminal cleavage/methylation domain-containing protein
MYFMGFSQRIIKMHLKSKGFSLLEMIITLVLTSIVLLALISLLTIILRISASTYNRSILREDTKNFALEFEKDLRNARRVGDCAGENESFQCDFFNGDYFRWRSCAVEESDICAGDSENCNDRSPKAQGGDAIFNIQPGDRLSMCKYIMNADGTLKQQEPVVVFDYNYNLNLFRVEEISDEPIDIEDPESESFKRVLAFTLVSSHPNKRLKINNILRQSLITTKNFEVLIQN